MKIQPLNQTALIVSWERPLTIYHPPITSYMVSYSWSKSDVADEKTFSKIGDQRTVSAISCLLQVFYLYRCLQRFRHLQHSPRVAMGSVHSSGDMLWWARHRDVVCCHKGEDPSLSLTRLKTDSKGCYSYWQRVSDYFRFSCKCCSIFLIWVFIYLFKVNCGKGLYKLKESEI